MALSSTTAGNESSTAPATSQYLIYPTLGLAGTCVGTAVAIALIPTDPYPAGALFYSAVSMTIGLAIAPVIASLRSPKSIFRAENILALSPIYWLLLDLLQGAYPLPGLNRDDVTAAFLAIGLFIAGLWISALSRPWNPPKVVLQSATYSLSPSLIYRLVLVFFILGILKFAWPSGFDPIKMYNSLFLSRWAAPWARGQFGGWSSFLDHMSYFGYLVPSLTVLLALRQNWRSPQVVVSIILSIIMTLFLGQGGSRRIVGVVIGSAIFLWAIEQKRFTLRHLIVLIVSGVILINALQTMLEFRNLGWQALLAGEKKSQYEHIHVDDNFFRLSQIIHFIPQDYPYVYEKQIIFSLIRPIPRVFWPEKPIDPGFDLQATVGSGGTLSSSVVGEWYLSGGFLAVIFGGWFYGKLASMGSSLLLKFSEKKLTHTLVYSFITIAVFAGIRSMLDLVLMSYMLVAWVLISSLTLKRRKPDQKV